MKARHVGVRVSPDELATLVKGARDLGVPMSVFIRGLLGLAKERDNGRPAKVPWRSKRIR